jgi:hypothetical protein
VEQTCPRQIRVHAPGSIIALRRYGVGIWHETYRVRTADIESIYGNMPPHGLAAATAAVPIGRGRDSAAARIGATTTDDPALPPY